jgi:beta-lactamase class A
LVSAYFSCRVAVSRVGGTTGLWTRDTGWVSLEQDVRSLVAVRPGKFGVYARNLVTNETVEIDADRLMPAESAAKTFILIHYARLVTSGAVDPATRVRLGDDNRWQLGTGVLRYLADGLEPTLDDLAWLMIIVSDNTATAMLMLAIGGVADVNATMASLDCPTARLNESITLEAALAGEPFSTSSPRDLAEAYTHLDDRCRAMLFRQQHLIGLPRKLPHMSYAADVGFTMPVRVFNKTGNGPGNFIDAGLVETEAATWIIAAMASDQPDFAARPDDNAPATFGEIGERIYGAWGPQDL